VRRRKKEEEEGGTQHFGFCGIVVVMQEQRGQSTLWFGALLNETVLRALNLLYSLAKIYRNL